MTALAVFFFGAVSAQLSEGEEPISFQMNVVFDAGEAAVFQGPDLDQVFEEDLILFEQTGREYMGRRIECDFGTNNLGKWHQLPDGSSVWTATLRSEGAQALAVIFEDLHIPHGGRLWAYTAERDFYDGPHEPSAVNQWHTLLTGDVYGDEVTLEYHQPSWVKEPLQLRIAGLAYFYRHIYDVRYEASRGSDPCQVDVRCPEGDAWENQRHSVVRLLISDGNGLFLCSGVMMNNLNRDCRQLMLTAYHCVTGINPTNFNQMVARFSYEKSGCGTGVGPTTRNRTGMTLLAHSNDGGGNNGSDFALFEVNTEIPLAAWNVYFAGWDANNTAATSGVSIHHPSGDFKKISTFTQTVLSATWWQAANAHWRVVWAPTANGHGVTEGGSSGSPLFNQHKRVVGTLTGGSSFCTAPFAPDMYGKMSFHWTQNPNSPNHKLKEWLDPNNTGITSMEGSFAPCTSGLNTEEITPIAEVSVYPNPTTDILSVSGLIPGEGITLSIVDPMGRVISTHRLLSDRIDLDVRDLASGVYFITVSDMKGRLTTDKFVKQ